MCECENERDVEVGTGWDAKLVSPVLMPLTE